jgi:hypothetical protein
MTNGLEVTDVFDQAENRLHTIKLLDLGHGPSFCRSVTTQIKAILNKVGRLVSHPDFSVTG